MGHYIEGSKFTESTRCDCLLGEEIGRCVTREWQKVSVCLGYPETKAHMTAFWLKSQIQHLRFSRDAMSRLHRLTYCRWFRYSSIIFCWQLNYSRNLEFSHPLLRISLIKVVCYVSPAWLHQFVKIHLLLPKTLYLMLYYFGNWGNHPAGFIIFTELTKFRIISIIILVFRIISIVRTGQNLQTISNGNQHPLKCCFRLCGCQCHLFNISHIVQFLRNYCVCIFNSLYCHSGLSTQIILESLLLLFVV